MLPAMEHHVYHLTDDSVTVVLISYGPLPPRGRGVSAPSAN